MDSTFEEQRAVIKFLLEEGEKPMNIFQRLKSRFGDACMARRTFYVWVGRFRDGRTSVQNIPPPGRPVDTITPTMIANVEEFILKDRRTRLDDIVEKYNISKGSAFTILHDHLGMRKVSARWVPKQLSDDQKANRVTACESHLARFRKDGEKFLNHIITGDETWIHYAEPETKQQSKQWKRPGSPPPKKFKQAPSAGKVMAVIFWDHKGIILIDIVPKGCTVTAKYYTESVLPKLSKNLKEKRPKLAQKNVLFLHDNAPAHTAALTTEFLSRSRWEVMTHPPYSPDLAPSDYYLFPNLKKMLAGNRYDSKSALTSAVNQYLRHRPGSWFAEGIRMLPGRWENVS